MHVVNDKFLEHLTVHTTNPGLLHVSYQGVLDLPAPLYYRVTAEVAMATLQGLQGTFKSMVDLLGRTAWPVSAREVARRAVGQFRARVPWSRHSYMNGSKQDPHVVEHFVDFEVVFDSADACWRAHIDPTAGHVAHNAGCKPFDVEGDSIEDVLKQVQEFLEAASRATALDTRQRLELDQKKFQGTKSPEPELREHN